MNLRNVEERQWLPNSGDGSARATQIGALKPPPRQIHLEPMPRYLSKETNMNFELYILQAAKRNLKKKKKDLRSFNQMKMICKTNRADEDEENDRHFEF